MFANKILVIYLPYLKKVTAVTVNNKKSFK